MVSGELRQSGRTIIIFNQAFTVLIVDDAPDVIELIRVILQDQGIDCISAPDGERGIDIAVSGSVDLILLDIILPGSDGFEVCAQLKKNSATKDIPVIFITAKGDDDSVARAFELGAVDYIPKPFSRYEMLSRVESHLRIIAQRRELDSQIGIKDRVLSIIAHEIRNQFSSLISVYELFNDDVKSMNRESLADHLRQLSSGLTETRELFDNLITWSKNQRGKLKIRSQKLHLYSLAQEILNSMYHTLESKELTLEINIDPAVFVQSDEVLSSLIIRNFVSNAVKFSFRCGNIEIFDQKRDGGLAVCVKDRGIGVDPLVKDDLFDIEKNPTTQGTEKEKGTGIGLIICRDFANELGAAVEFESEPGKGAVFSLLYPGTLVL